jgi:chromosome segregation ATPase
MGRTSDTLKPRDPAAADALGDAKAELRQGAIAAGMRQASDDLQANRMGQAADKQSDIAGKLRSLLDILGGKGGGTTAQRAEKLAEAQKAIGLMKKDQANARQGIEAAAKQGNPNARKSGLEQARQDQKQLAQAAESLAHKLKRLEADDAAKNTSAASGSMRQSSDDAKQGDAKSAADHAKEAEKTLEKADQDVKRALVQAKAELIFEQMARMEDSLKHLYAQEQRVLGDTREYDGLRHAGTLTAAQVSGLRDLAQLQGEVHEEADHVVETTEPESVFRLALSEASADLALASAALQRAETGPNAQKPEQRALDRMAQVLEALKPEPPDNKAGQKPPGAKEDEPKKNSPPADQLASLVALKLLKSMQEDVNRRTKLLGEAVAAGKLTADEAQPQFDTLSEEQGRLAALALKFLSTQSPGPPPETDEPPAKEDP